MEEDQLIRSPLVIQNVNDRTRNDFLRDLATRFWAESKLLWRISAASTLSRIAMAGSNVISQAFVGHIGDLELAAFSLVIAIIVWFDCGIMIGMGNALGTVCGQAFGAKKHHMLGIYLQRSWIVLFGFALLLLPVYMFTSPILRFLGQPEDIAELAGRVSLWCIPMHFSFPLYYSCRTYLASQSKNMVIAWSGAAGTALCVALNWLFVIKWNMGLAAALFSLNVGWWIPAIAQLLYVTCGGCPLTWIGLSMEAFYEIWSFLKLAVASGVMLCLEIWYYSILVLMTGTLKDAQVIVDALSICLNINQWEMAIPLGFLVATSVRVANQLGAGIGSAAKFTIVVAVISSSLVGIVIWLLILVFRNELGYLFTNSIVVQEAVGELAVLLAFTILVNSVQQVLSGVAIGLGKQGFVAYVNIGCYYLIGLPLGLILGFLFDLEIKGVWTGMICGTTIQTLVLIFITLKINWDKEVTNITLEEEKTSSKISFRDGEASSRVSSIDDEFP